MLMCKEMNSTRFIEILIDSKLTSVTKLKIVAFNIHFYRGNYEKDNTCFCNNT